MQHSSLLRAGSQFREKAQRYHNAILSNASSARERSRAAFDGKKISVRQSMEGLAPIC
jgi:hypothetical protein